MSVSLQKPRSAPTVALHWLMDQAQAAEISARARSLKDASRETNRSIADYCGVTERSVAGWLSPSGPKPMTYDNAAKYAELFNVDVDWLWRGREKGPAPDVLAALSGETDRLARIEEALERMEARQVEALAIVAEIRQNQSAPPSHRRPSEGDVGVSAE